MDCLSENTSDLQDQPGTGHHRVTAHKQTGLPLDRFVGAPACESAGERGLQEWRWSPYLP